MSSVWDDRRKEWRIWPEILSVREREELAHVHGIEEREAMMADAVRRMFENGRVYFPHGDGVPQAPDPRSPWQGPDQTCLLTKQAKAPRGYTNPRPPAPCPRRAMYAFSVETAPPAPRMRQYDPSKVQVSFLSADPGTGGPPIAMHDNYASTPRLAQMYELRDKLAATRTSRDEYQACAEGLRDKLAASERELIGTRITRDNNCAIAESRLKLVDELRDKLAASERELKRFEIDRDAARRARDGYMGEAVEQDRGRRASDAECARLREELERLTRVEKDLAIRNKNQAEEIMRLRELLAQAYGRVLW